MVIALKLEHIKLFLDVVDSGSISQAAKMGYITQQGLSSALKQIESELQICLFNRSNKGVELTDEGEKFYQCSREMIKRYDDFLFELHDDGMNNVFNVYIANNMHKMLPYLNEAAFAKRNKIYFSYIERQVDDVIRLINENKGIAIISTHAASNSTLLNNVDKNLRLHKIGSEDEVVCVCYKESPLANCSIEEIKDIMSDMKCVLSSSEQDINFYQEKVRKTICIPDVEGCKHILKEQDVYGIMTLNTYRLHFSPSEFFIIRTRKLEQNIEYYLILNLKMNQANITLEKELLSYLEEIFGGGKI